MALKIRTEQLDQLRRHGEEAYPRECCGVLVGELASSGGTVRDVIPCGNICTESPEKRYRISPADLIRIQREARLMGHVIVGFYHSHPDRPAQWSSTDLAEAYWSGCSYVSISVQRGRAVVTSSFVLRGAEELKHFEDEAIEAYLAP